MKANKYIIIQKLKDKGLVLDASIEKELLTSYSVFLQGLVDDEVHILEEVLRIQEKIVAEKKITYLEDVFYEYVVTKYKKS